MLENLKVVNCKNCPSFVMTFFDKDIFIGDNFIYQTNQYKLKEYVSEYLYLKTKKIYDFRWPYKDEEVKEGIIMVADKIPSGRHSFHVAGYRPEKIEDFIDINDFFNNLFIFDYSCKERTAELYKFGFCLEEDTLTIYLNDTLKILDNADFDKDEEGLKSFLSGVFINKDVVDGVFRSLFFTRNKSKLGYMDIFLDLKSYIYRNPIGNKIEEILENKKSMETSFNIQYFLAWSYFLKDEFFGIVEKLLKDSREGLIISYNPAFSGKPIPDVKTLRSLSSISKKFLDNLSYCRNAEELETAFLEIEDSPKFGVDGLVVCKKYFDILNDIDKGFDSDWYSVLRFGSSEASLIINIYKIIDTFDISVKDFLDKAVRAMFYYHMNISTYIQTVLDYVEMSNRLGLPLPKKFPKEIIEGHNLLKKRQDYLSNQELEDKFNKALIFNEGNLAFIPDSKKFTIISPKNSIELVNEGLYLNHCVGSYVEKVALGYSKIYFVRLIGDEKTPFVTVELDKYDNLVQMSCMNDKSPEKEVWDFVLEWINNLK